MTACLHDGQGSGDSRSIRRRSEPQAGLMTPLRVHVPAIAAVCASEWHQLVSASRTFVFLAGLLLAVSASVFLIGGLYDSDFASLDLVWSSLPIIGIALVPALGARAFADENGSREIELMLSLPVADVDLVVGKWLAGAAMLAIALVLLLAPIAATVAYLGSPDWGAAASGALGALLMLWTVHALAILASASTAQQTTAYVVAVLMAMTLTALGWDLAAQAAPLPAGVLDAFRLLSPKFNLDRMASGRIESDALLSFLVEIGLALSGACVALSVRRRAGMTRGQMFALAAKGTAVALAAFAFLGISARVPLAVDATAERLFTLSDATRQIAAAVPAGTEIELYWSEADASVPAHVRDFAHRVRSLLAQVQRSSAGRLSLRVLDPIPDSKAEWTAIASGIRRVPLSSGGAFFLGMVLRSGDRRQVTSYLDETRAPRVEYDLALALSRIGEARIPKAGLLTSLVTPSELTEARPRHAFVEALRAAYDLAVIPFFADGLPDDLDVLVVIGEEPLKQSMLRAIDQHVMRGRGLVVLLDPMTRFNASGKLVSASATHDINTVADLLARYGIAFNANVVGDADLAAVLGGDTKSRLAYPFWIRVTEAELGTSPISAGLRDVVFVEPGSFVLSAGATGLVTTGARAGAVPASALAGKSPADAAQALKPDGVRRVLVATTGSALSSAFDAAGGASHVARVQRAAVFAVADVDWILDQVATGTTESGARLPTNDNLAYFGNMVEAAAGDHRLLSIRARAAASRRFTRIEQMLKAGEARHREEVAQAQSRIDKVEGTIAEILKTTKARSVADLPADIRGRISGLYAETIPARQRLRELRSSMREDVERLGRVMTALNIASGPVSAFAMWAIMRRLRARKAPGPAQ